jgi:SAM-dependent methyltransferase
VTIQISATEVSFSTRGGGATQDEEWCEITVDGERRRIRFHDYDEIFQVPGLYERIFHDHLQCRSPQEVCKLLAEELAKAGAAPDGMRAIDVGAGNGLVAEELRRIGVGPIVGADIIPEAAEAAERDRPELYEDYVVCDLTDLDDAERTRLAPEPADCMTTVAALGFADIPPAAFAAAFNLVRPGGWIAFNIKADFLDNGDRSGFKELILRMFDEGLLTECARRRYRHRMSITGEELMYVAVVGVKRGDIPEDWT